MLRLAILASVKSNHRRGFPAASDYSTTNASGLLSAAMRVHVTKRFLTSIRHQLPKDCVASVTIHVQHDQKKNNPLYYRRSQLDEELKKQKVNADSLVLGLGLSSRTWLFKSKAVTTTDCQTQSSTRTMISILKIVACYCVSSAPSAGFRIFT